MGAPGLDPADLLARDRRAEHGVADQLVRGRVREHLVLDPEVAEDLHRPLVGDVRAGRVGRPPVLGDHDVRHPEGGQAERGRAAGRARADDQHVGLDRGAGRDLGLGESVIEGRHGLRTPFSVRDCLCHRPRPPRAAPPNGGNEKLAGFSAMMMDRCVHPGVHNDPSSAVSSQGVDAEVAGAVAEVLAEGVREVRGGRETAPGGRLGHGRRVRSGQDRAGQLQAAREDVPGD